MDEKDSSPIPVGYQMLQYLRGHREVICSQRHHNSLYLKATTIKPKITKKQNIIVVRIPGKSIWCITMTTSGYK